VARKDVIRQLRTKYPRIIFLALVGHARENLDRIVRIGARLLSPALRIEQFNELIDLDAKLSAALKANGWPWQKGSQQ
jgi:hypothetical protein